VAHPDLPMLYNIEIPNVTQLGSKLFSLIGTVVLRGRGFTYTPFIQNYRM